MPRLQQGMIVWATMPAPIGERPVVVLTRDLAIGRLNSITVAPVTRTIRNIPTEVVLQPTDGVVTVCAVSLDSILTIPRAAFGERIAVLSRDRILEIFDAIRSAFEMP